MRVSRLGDRALLVDLELGPVSRGARTLAAASALRSRLPLSDIAVAAGSLLIDGVDPWTDLSPLLAGAARQAAEPPPAEARGPLRLVEVVYDGPDLASVAAQLRMEIPDIIRLHTGAEHAAEFLGFLPGFAYLGPAPAPLALPRRPTPRPAVPALSVAVAGGFSGIYPSTTPGGWHLLGRAPRFAPFAGGRPALAPGDRVRFVAVDDAQEGPEPPAPPGPSPARALRVIAAPACATVQDAGRAGRLHQGLPPSGPLDPSAHAAANLAAGNEPGAAAVEIPLGSLEIEAVGDHLCSLDGEPPWALRHGERRKISPCERAVRYLAVAGGVDVALASGSRSTLLSARLGGLGGRPLRRGDLVPVGPDTGRPGPAPAPPAAPASPASLLFHPGPHLDRFAGEALDLLTSAEFRVSRLGDRVGVRLEGPPIPLLSGRLELPAPMVRGAIEVSTDGVPIVLGPDHPVTGGYPVIGALTCASQALLARLYPGHPVRFAAV